MIYINKLKNPKYNLNFFLNYNSKLISKDSISDVININLDNQDLFIKRYYKPGRKLYSKLALYTSLISSKAKREVRNLLYFKNNNFITPEILFFNEHKGKACIVTKACVNSQDLFAYLSNNSINNKNIKYLFEFVNILAELHKNNFIHRDYKLRNVLLEQDNNNNKLYLIDCPNGVKFNYLLAKTVLYFVVRKLKLRDLVIAYQELKKILSKKLLLALYKQYYKISPVNKLSDTQKNELLVIINYFNK